MLTIRRFISCNKVFKRRKPHKGSFLSIVLYRLLNSFNYFGTIFFAAGPFSLSATSYSTSCPSLSVL